MIETVKAGVFGFTVNWTNPNEGYHMCFVAYEIASDYCQHADGRVDTRPHYMAAGQDMTDSLDDAEVYASGHIKWTGVQKCRLGTGALICADMGAGKPTSTLWRTCGGAPANS